MHLKKTSSRRDTVEDVVKETENHKLETEEGQKKAQSLFSKKFMEYLHAKKSNQNVNIKKNPSKSYDLNSYHAHKEYPSSDETSEASCSSWKTNKKSRKKMKAKTASHHSLTFDYACRSKLTQCNLIEETEEIMISEDLKPFLMNMTILLQELRQSWNDSSEYESVYNLISKITILISEFGRRHITEIEPEKRGEHFKALEKTMGAILSLINEYKKSSTFDFDNGIREYKKIEKELAVKTQQVEDARTILAMEEEELKIDHFPSDIELKVKNSILNNERLKAQIKFNQARIKKYKKSLVEKEWAKHKLNNEIVHLKKKISKTDLTDDTESYAKSIASADVSLKSRVYQKDAGSNFKSPRQKKDKK
ncbi:hypothetical protein RUM43_001025 [Polyplax serrata]|uniref:Uncharacterized protein n=1 Tax=Polyplax serrata TaxID=468196 RepID=A0AAN8SH09_POLSC